MPSIGADAVCSPEGRPVLRLEMKTHTLFLYDVTTREGYSNGRNTGRDFLAPRQLFPFTIWGHTLPVFTGKKDTVSWCKQEGTRSNLLGIESLAPGPRCAICCIIPSSHPWIRCSQLQNLWPQRLSSSRHSRSASQEGLFSGGLIFRRSSQTLAQPCVPDSSGIVTKRKGYGSILSPYNRDG